MSVMPWMGYYTASCNSGWDKNIIKDNAKLFGWMADPIKLFDIVVNYLRDNFKNGITPDIRHDMPYKDLMEDNVEWIKKGFELLALKTALLT
jgi:hypothetical protein